MICPHCKNWVNNLIIDSRPIDDRSRRYRRYKCSKCAGRFSTKEIQDSVFEDLVSSIGEEVRTVRELKVIVRYLMDLIFQTPNPKDITPRLLECTDEMRERIQKYFNKSFGKE